MPLDARIRQVRIRNYKSIAEAVVDLDDLTLFVGANGSGKSNFFEALGFVRDSLSDRVDLAFKNRGGIQAVRRRSGGHPTHVAIGLSVDLGDGGQADYSFEIGAQTGGGFRVTKERCEVRRLMEPTVTFETEAGRFVREVPGIRPRLAPDRLALVAVSGTEEFRPVFEFLTAMRFYSVVPQQLRAVQEPDAGDVLAPDGRNAAAVLKRLQEDDAAVYERVCRTLATAVEGVTGVAHRSIGPMETLEFRKDVGLKDPWRFDAQNMSDGTLRVLGLLLALYQTGDVSLIGIEEPESTVHPAVAELLLDVLRDASQDRQVLVTTHSPDVLDSKHLDAGQIRVVEMTRGITRIGPMTETDRRTVRERLFTPGELLRANDLAPDDAEASRTWKQATLFDAETV